MLCMNRESSYVGPPRVMGNTEVTVNCTSAAPSTADGGRNHYLAVYEQRIKLCGTTQSNGKHRGYSKLHKCSTQHRGGWKHSAQLTVGGTMIILLGVNQPRQRNNLICNQINDQVNN